MNNLSRITRPSMTRRQPNYWIATEDLFRPLMEMVNSPMRTNIKETDDKYLFEAEMPGFEASEIDLSIQNDVLTIAAEHKEGEEGSDAYSTRSVRRSFTVEGVDEDAISAQYKNGILRVTLPKAKAPEAPEARKITVSE